MIYLVYSSTATHSMGEDELEAVLRQSRAHNQRDDITGMLLYHDRRFIQLIEGPDTVILECYARITQDVRHSAILKLVQKPLNHRYFQKWSMAFEHIDPAQEGEEGFSQFLSEPYSSMELGPELHEGLFLLLAFEKQVMENHRSTTA